MTPNPHKAAPSYRHIVLVAVRGPGCSDPHAPGRTHPVPLGKEAKSKSHREEIT